MIISAGGLRQQWKPRWGVYDKSQCKLRFYKSDFEEDIVGEIDVLSGTFTYDLENDQNGQFKIWKVSLKVNCYAGTKSISL